MGHCSTSLEACFPAWWSIRLQVVRPFDEPSSIVKDAALAVTVWILYQVSRLMHIESENWSRIAGHNIRFFFVSFQQTSILVWARCSLNDGLLVSIAYKYPYCQRMFFFLWYPNRRTSFERVTFMELNSLSITVPSSKHEDRASRG